MPETRITAMSSHSWTLVLAGSLAASLTAHAQPVELIISSPPTPVGSGARATGAGSAFVAIADDATAASWNPAGLVQLERPEVAVVMRGSYRSDSIGTVSEDKAELGAVTASVGVDGTSVIDLNYLSAVIPFAIRGTDVVLSVNYQQVLSFERKLGFRVLEDIPSGPVTIDWKLDQQGSVYAVSPALGIDLLPGLSAGVAINHWFDGIGRGHAWTLSSRQHFDVRFGGNAHDEFDSTTNQVFRDIQGTNATFGLLWRKPDGLGLGAFLKLPFHATGTSIENTVIPEGSFTNREDFRFRYPISYGAGVSWRLRDRFTTSVDATRVEWGDFRIQDFRGADFLITGDPAGQATVDGTVTVRGGFEYLVVDHDMLWALRGGLFYEPEPARGSPADFYGFSVGAGLTYGHVSVDVSYQLRAGFDVNGSPVFSQIFDVPSGEGDVVQNLLYASVVGYL